jgi:hypothetical protein
MLHIISLLSSVTIDQIKTEKRMPIKKDYNLNDVARLNTKSSHQYTRVHSNKVKVKVKHKGIKQIFI